MENPQGQSPRLLPKLVAAMDARSSLAEPPVDFGGGNWALKGELGHGASGRVCLGVGCNLLKQWWLMIGY